MPVLVIKLALMLVFSVTIIVLAAVFDPHFIDSGLFFAIWVIGIVAISSVSARLRHNKDDSGRRKH